MVTDSLHFPENPGRTPGDGSDDNSWTRADIHRAMKRAMRPVEQLRAAIVKRREDLAQAIIGDATEQEVAEWGCRTPVETSAEPCDECKAAQPPSYLNKPCAKVHVLARRGGRPDKLVEGLTCGQWMAAQAAKDPSVTNRSGREWAKVGPWRSPRTYEKTEIWQQWKHLRDRQAIKAAKQAGTEFSGRLGECDEMPGIRVGRKSALGRQRLSKKDREHNRKADEWIALAEAEKKAE